MINTHKQTTKLSLIEKVFTTPLFFSEEGLKPGFFKNKDLSTLSSTSQALNSVIKSELHQRAAQKLLTHVVLGEQTKAQVMIKANPKLLLIQSKAIDYSGRTIIATPFQAAIGAGDKPMWEMMLPFFEGLKPGEALRQFQIWFPNGIEDNSASELQNYYNAIALSIIHDEDGGLSVIEQFRKDIGSQHEIRQGKHFNLQHLIAAYQAYYDNYVAFDQWEKRDVFWQKVIGFVQRQMTTYDAQIYCSGIKHVLDDEKTFLRTLTFSDGKEFFPLLADFGLGFNFAYYSFTYLISGSSYRHWMTAMPYVHDDGIIFSYVEKKKMDLLNLENYLSKVRLQQSL